MLKEGEHSKDIDVGVTQILKQILKKYGVLKTGGNCLSMGCVRRLL
jgi:hypothetical protein